jgi:hypothetical protein
MRTIKAVSAGSEQFDLALNIGYLYDYEDVCNAFQARWDKLEALPVADPFLLVMPDYEISEGPIAGALGNLTDYLQGLQGGISSSTHQAPDCIHFIPYNTSGHWVTIILRTSPDNRVLKDAVYIDSNGIDRVVTDEQALASGGELKEHALSPEEIRDLMVACTHFQKVLSSVQAVYPGKTVYRYENSLQSDASLCGPLCVENAVSAIKYLRAADASYKAEKIVLGALLYGSEEEAELTDSNFQNPACRDLFLAMMQSKASDGKAIDVERLAGQYSNGKKFLSDLSANASGTAVGKAIEDLIKTNQRRDELRFKEKTYGEEEALMLRFNHILMLSDVPKSEKNTLESKLYIKQQAEVGKKARALCNLEVAIPVSTNVRQFIESLKDFPSENIEYLPEVFVRSHDVDNAAYNCEVRRSLLSCVDKSMSDEETQLYHRLMTLLSGLPIRDEMGGYDDYWTSVGNRFAEGITPADISAISEAFPGVSHSPARFGTPYGTPEPSPEPSRAPSPQASL